MRAPPEPHGERVETPRNNHERLEVAEQTIPRFIFLVVLGVDDCRVHGDIVRRLADA
jgi:hypothetical protein